MKRTFDLVVASVGLVLLSPIWLASALCIKLDDGGPVLYGGWRVGRFGVPFRMLKFRTMVADAESLGGTSTAADDPRITRVGAVLRRYKVDELPQLLNVLCGQMSLVGPRPQVQWAVERYSVDDRIALSVRPGITDLASIQFADEAEILRGAADPDQTYMQLIHPEKMRLAREYVAGHSFWLDLRILARTAAAVLPTLGDRP